MNPANIASENYSAWCIQWVLSTNMLGVYLWLELRVSKSLIAKEGPKKVVQSLSKNGVVSIGKQLEDNDKLACGLSNHGVVSSGKQQLEADDKLASDPVKHGVDQQ